MTRSDWLESLEPGDAVHLVVSLPDGDVTYAATVGSIDVDKIMLFVAGWKSLCGRLAPKEFGELHEGYGLSDCPACVFLQARLARKHDQQLADHDAKLAAQLPTLRPAPLGAHQPGHR